MVLLLRDAVHFACSVGKQTCLQVYELLDRTRTVVYAIPDA